MRSFLFLILLICSFNLFAENPEKKIDALLEYQITSLTRNDYKSFILNGSDEFKKITIQDFAKVVQQLSGRLTKGHEEIFLTVLNQDGYLVHVWKVTFKDKGNDILAKMIVGKDDKVLGFWLQ